MHDKKRKRLQRQRYISLLEKIARNLYKSFKNKEEPTKLVDRFNTLYEQLDELETIYLESSYHKELKHYIQSLHKELKKEDAAPQEYVADFYDKQVNRLNRLQKLKRLKRFSRKERNPSHEI